MADAAEGQDELSFERSFAMNLNSNFWPTEPELETPANYFHSVAA